MKKRIVSFVLLFLCVVIVTMFAVKSNNKTYIEKVLSSEEYNYLPKEAQNYVEEVYKKTGNVIKTEKNKEQNEPYLNPAYVAYLSLTEEERKEMDLIPESLIVEYIPNNTYGDESFPTQYNISSLNGGSYITPIKDQGQLGVCWAFTSVETAETYLMFKNNTPYNSSTTETFSVRQMDYATSTDGLYYNSPDGNQTFSNSDNGMRELGSGGDFYVSTMIMSNGLSLFDNSQLPYNSLYTQKKVSDILNQSKSKYEVNKTIMLGTLDMDEPDTTTLTSYVNDIKHYILLHGSAFVGTISPNSGCAFKNVTGDSKKVIKVDDCYNGTYSGYYNYQLGHAMQIIGWNDNYQYKYCDKGTSNVATTSSGTCSSGTLKSGEGAWILRNSWGSTDQYVYLTYNSTRAQVGFIADMSSMSNRTWDYNYHENYLESGYMYGTTANLAYFSVNVEGPEKVEKIKFCLQK